MLKLKVLSPSQMLFEGSVESVTLPGSVSPFTVLASHAPIITSLEKGDVVCMGPEGEQRFHSNGGFAEVRDNVVCVCVD